ncbi:hypothetical protein L596_000311 [Steinernema carpocapsae]|uniref:Uncharacterized protein n=1 Tax=Steinernema carpocapsae TaxID=34508 RepID=A0A4U8UIL6_STECR|nr:hypothetical protein L596_000311 [Steinernema carpocapsae]
MTHVSVLPKILAQRKVTTQSSQAPAVVPDPILFRIAASVWNMYDRCIEWATGVRRFFRTLPFLNRFFSDYALQQDEEMLVYYQPVQELLND